MELTINTSTKSITIHDSVNLKELNEFLGSKFSEDELSEYSVLGENKPFGIVDPIHPFNDRITYTTAPPIPSGFKILDYDGVTTFHSLTELDLNN